MDKEDTHKDKEYCVKLILDDGNDRRKKLFGIIINDTDPIFLTFQTATRTYKFNKSKIVSIENTNELFKGRVEYD